MSWAQCRRIGLSTATIRDWSAERYLQRKLPGVYAVGHSAPSIEGDLAGALLYAGPGAVLSHATAAWWWGLTDEPASPIHVSTPRRCRSLPEVRVHSRRSCRRVWHRGLPVTSVAQTLVDFSAGAPINRVRVLLANAEYRGLLDLKEVRELLGVRRRGGATLRRALERHEPRLARARSGPEITFIELCESHGIPMPEVNVRMHGWTVDFFWPAEGVVVEVDPYGNHHTPAQVDRDRRKDLALRARGLVVNRYSRRQVEDRQEEVAADVIATLAARRAA